MDLEHEIPSSGYSSSSSCTIMGSKNWRICDSEQNQFSAQCSGASRLDFGYYEHDIVVEEDLPPCNRKRKASSTQCDMNMKRAFSGDGEVIYVMDGDYDEILFSDSSINSDSMDTEAIALEFDIDGGKTVTLCFDNEEESEISESDWSLFESGSDTEREEDGYSSTEYDELDTDSDVGGDLQDIEKIAQVLSNGYDDVIVRHRFPYLSIGVHLSDITCLLDDEFVNDTIVDFCLNHLVFNAIPEDAYRIHVFPSMFFYSMEMQLIIEAERSTDTFAERLMRRFANFTPYVENVDLFENDFLVIPLNDLNHWSLCIVCCPNKLIDCSEIEFTNVIEARPCVVLLDSQIDQQPNLIKYGNHIREFLQFAYIYHNGFSDDFQQRFSVENFPNVTPKRLPQQTNGFDCGIFMLEYVREFFTKPPNIRELAGGNMDFLTEYPNFRVSGKRAAWRREIMSMSEDREGLEKLLGRYAD